MSQFHFDPSTYAELMQAEVPGYDGLQDRIVAAVTGTPNRVLDLGAGTGETTRRLLEHRPQSHVVAVDESPAMLELLDDSRVEKHVARLQDPLPDGTFDLVVSALAVHHLDADEKQDLFRRVHAALAEGGRFVLGDVVLVETAVAPLTEGYDKPDRADDQLRWLTAAGFAARLVWEQDDLALLIADRGPW